MKTVWISSMVVLAIAVVALGVIGVGCDNVTTSDQVITLTPSAVVVTGTVFQVYRVVDTNNTLLLPLRWSVSDAQLGSITSEGGLSGLYVSNARAGVNTIRVKDQGDAEGIAVVSQLYAAGMVITPSTANINRVGAPVQFQASVNISPPGGGDPVPGDPGALVLPLVWWVSNPSLGNVTSSGGLNAVYVSTGAEGYNIVYVRDQMGAEATAIIDQD